EARVLQFAERRVDERMHRRRHEDDRARPRGAKRADVVRGRRGAGRVHHAERQTDAGDDRREAERASGFGGIGHAARTPIGTSTKSCAASSQRKARASPRSRASDTTTYVTSGYAGSSPNIPRARSSSEKYDPLMACEW